MNLQEFISPRHRETISAVKNGDHAHFRIEGGQLGNVNWLVPTKIGMDRLVCNVIQLVTRCPPMPQTKHRNIVTSSR